MGIETPKIEVRFQNLSIEGDAYVGTRALPTLLNSTLNSIEVISSICCIFSSECHENENWICVALGTIIKTIPKIQVSVWEILFYYLFVHKLYF